MKVYNPESAPTQLLDRDVDVTPLLQDFATEEYNEEELGPFPASEDSGGIKSGSGLPTELSPPGISLMLTPRLWIPRIENGPVAKNYKKFPAKGHRKNARSTMMHKNNNGLKKKRAYSKLKAKTRMRR